MVAAGQLDTSPVNAKPFLHRGHHFFLCVSPRLLETEHCNLTAWKQIPDSTHSAASIARPLRVDSWVTTYSTLGLRDKTTTCQR